MPPVIGSSDFPKISHVKKQAFLAAFSRCGSLSKAAKRAKVDRRTHYNWLKDPSYVEAFRQAVVEAGDSLQDRLTEMAFEGNVTAAIFLLKGLKPQQFRDRMEQTNLMEADWSNLSSQQLDVLMEAYLKKMLGTSDPKVLESAKRQLDEGKTIIDIEGESTAVETPAT
jgi:hypothetical protein